MSGLLSSQRSEYKGVRDKHALEYIADVERIWFEIKNDIENKPMDGESWSFKYSRPGNYPTRRIAAISRLLAENYETGIFRVIVYNFHSKFSPNNITRFMNYRILGKDSLKGRVVNSARRQQGLLQIFKDFCESDDISCEKCMYFYDQLTQWRR